MRWVSRGISAPGAVLAAVLAAPAARAEGVVDSSYGRISGDATLGVGLGASVSAGGPRAEGEVRVRYLESVGLLAAYEDGPLVASAARPQRALVGALELRPLFLYRWLQGHETDRAWLDLAVDSLGLELGVVGEQPAGQGFASQAAWLLGGGIEVPLFPSATGPWIAIHGGVRWSERALSGVGGDDDRAAYLTVTLGWHQVLSVHAVDLGDRAPR